MLSKKWNQVSSMNQSNFWRRVLIFQAKKPGQINDILGTIALGSQGSPHFLASQVAIPNTRVLQNLIQRQDAMNFLKDTILR